MNLVEFGQFFINLFFASAMAGIAVAGLMFIGYCLCVIFRYIVWKWKEGPDG